jgi:hypothetical protein
MIVADTEAKQLQARIDAAVKALDFVLPRCPCPWTAVRILEALAILGPSPKPVQT